MARTSVAMNLVSMFAIVGFAIFTTQYLQSVPGSIGIAAYRSGLAAAGPAGSPAARAPACSTPPAPPSPTALTTPRPERRSP